MLNEFENPALPQVSGNKEQSGLSEEDRKKQIEFFAQRLLEISRRFRENQKEALDEAMEELIPKPDEDSQNSETLTFLRRYRIEIIKIIKENYKLLSKEEQDCFDDFVLKGGLGKK